MRLRHFARLIALVSVVGLVASACGGGPAEQPQQQPRRGGSIVLGAEQAPECVNPITSCQAASWAWWSLFHHVLPRAMEVDLQGNYVNSPVLRRAPSLDNGLITQNPFTVRFEISPRAVWEDGSRMTSEDFDFTWRAIMNTPGAYTTAGYDQVDSIDTSDPQTAVIRFKQPYAAWPEMFGGSYQGFFKAAAFPEFRNDPEPNLEREMLESLPFSGGPFILDNWSKEELTLVRNDRYFGKKSLLDRITIVLRDDQETEIQSILSGEVAAVFPQPANVSMQQRVAGNPNAKVLFGTGIYYEALWFQLERAPLNDIRVREAFMHAVDRNAVINGLIKLNNPRAAVLNCPFNTAPHIGQWCTRPYFAQFTYNPQRSIQILEGAGYDCSGVPANPCTKDGEPLVIEYSTVAGNSRRETTQELLVDRVKPAGFQFKIKNYDAGVLFGDVAPKGQFMIADYATSILPDPSITSSYACDYIPTAENEYTGGNWNHWCNEEATRLMKQSDQAVDPAERRRLLDRVYQLQAEDKMSLPLYILPNVTIFRADKVAGPVGRYNDHVYGAFYNMNEWFVPARAGA